MRPSADAVGAYYSKCAQRKPYHVVLTAASGLYQEWQTRIAYYHYKKLKASHFCSDIGGFTRLLNTPNAQPDRLMNEIPTVLVSQLGHGRCESCDHGFIVMNRPWGIRQLVRHPLFATIPESYLLLMETDHLFLKPIPNWATPTMPVGFSFYYMTYRYDPAKLRPVIAKYHDPERVDPVGPSPVIIQKDQLRELVDSWWQLCVTLKRDPEADRAFGWVLEMWAWTLAAAKAGVRHKVVSQLQAEPGGIGIPSIDNYYLYHYTFDLDGGSFRWSKRSFMGRYPAPLRGLPARMMLMPSTSKFVDMMNEAMAAINPWGPK